MNKISLAKFVNKLFVLWKNNQLNLLKIEEEKFNIDSSFYDFNVSIYYDTYNLVTFFSSTNYYNITNTLSNFISDIEALDKVSYTYITTYIYGLSNEFKYYQTLEVINHIHYFLRLFNYNNMEINDKLTHYLKINMINPIEVFLLENTKNKYEQLSLFSENKVDETELSKLKYDLKTTMLNSLINDIVKNMDIKSFNNFKTNFNNMLDMSKLPKDIKVFYSEYLSYIYLLVNKRLSTKRNDADLNVVLKWKSLD